MWGAIEKHTCAWRGGAQNGLTVCLSVRTRPLFSFLQHTGGGLVVVVKVAINRKYGGFGLSREALEYLGVDPESNLISGHGFISLEDLGEEQSDDCEEDTRRLRTHPRLIECIETLGADRASGQLTSLKIVTIPDGVDWVIKDYDGAEWIAEKHRTWE